MTRTLRVGIASYEDMKARTMSIARGELRPSRNDPSVWFTSLESLGRILSAHNQALLELIAEQKPASLAELEELSGRAKSNLSRTLRTMERYGLVELSRGVDRKIVPRVPYSRIQLEMPLTRAGSLRSRQTGSAVPH
jgi:predicted transcriptional regulator